MTDMERIFNKQYIRYGGIFLDNDSDSGKEILKQTNNIRKKVNNYYKDKKAMFINFGGLSQEKTLKNINTESGKYHPYVNVYCADTNDINAFAGKVDDEYFIGILKGVFLNIGNHIKNYVEDECFEKIPEVGKCYPKAIMNNLVENCLDFFTFHEFFHVMNGHCDLIKEMGINELCEENTECSSRGMDLQTMEYDADCCAISSIVNEYFRIQYMAINSIDGMSGRPNIDSTIQFISGLLIAIYILNSWLNTLRITDQEITEEKLEKMTHPLPGTRTLYLWSTVNTVIYGLNVYSRDEIEQIADRSYESVFTFIKEFSAIAYPGFLMASFNKVGVRHLQKIHNNWKNVRELLTVHYCDLPPYEDVDFESIFNRR